jgi:hypothetical protein
MEFVFGAGTCGVAGVFDPTSGPLREQSIDCAKRRDSRPEATIFAIFRSALIAHVCMFVNR